MSQTEGVAEAQMIALFPTNLASFHFFNIKDSGIVQQRLIFRKRQNIISKAQNFHKKIAKSAK